MTCYTVGSVVFLIAPLIAIIVFYSRIMHSLRRAKPESHSKEGNSQQKRKKQNQSIMKIFKSIVAVFLGCYCLFCNFVTLKITYPDILIQNKCHVIRGFSYFVLPLLSSAVNPSILFSCSTNFRHALRALCPLSFCICRSCRELENGSQCQGNVGSCDMLSRSTCQMDESIQIKNWKRTRMKR